VRATAQRRAGWETVFTWETVNHDLSASARGGRGGLQAGPQESWGGQRLHPRRLAETRTSFPDDAVVGGCQGLCTRA
jgi:hypothetical protein